MKISVDGTEVSQLAMVDFKWDDGRNVRLYFRERGDEVVLEVMKTQAAKGTTLGTGLLVQPISGNVIYVE